MSSILDYFPISNTIPNIRNQQVTALDAIENAINNGKKIVMLSAPTGSGKSKIGETVMRYYKEKKINSLYCSPLNILVDQLEKTKCDTSSIYTFKSREYYPCIAQNETKQCDDGYCQNGVCSVTKLRGRYCKKCNIIGNADINGYIIKCKCSDCIYKAAFRRFRDSVAGNITCSMAMIPITNDPKVLIIDEIDDIENSIRLKNAVTVPYHVDSDDFIIHAAEALEYAESLESCLDCERTSYNCCPKKPIRLERKIESIKEMVNDYDEYNEDWIIKNEVNSFGIKRTKYEPITVERFIDSLIGNIDFILMMSATPPKRIHHDVFIEVDSPFPKEIRQCYFHPIGRFSKGYREQNMPKLATFLASLKYKTIVHCVSYPFAKLLATTLQSNENIWPLLQVPSGNGDSDSLNYSDYDYTSRNDAIDAFKNAKDPNKILLSVKLDRGTDFYEPEIQNNVIACIPWPNPSDQLTIAKNRIIGKTWQNEEVAIKVEQAHGRIHRGIFWKKDYPNFDLPTTKYGIIIKRTFITDSNFNNKEMGWWYNRNKQYFSKSFNEIFKYRIL